jgi:23S rRNA (cytosine1962-C5)-methyltransferase
VAAKAGAKEVTMVDSSALALELAMKAAHRNGVEGVCKALQGDAFAVMERLAKEGHTYDIVLADPPAFVKSKKDIASGLKGYEKVTRLAAKLVAPQGYLFVASCSHHAGRSAFNKAVLDGVAKAGLKCEIVKQTSASGDHPRHAFLQQNEYLKGILLAIRNH